MSENSWVLKGVEPEVREKAVAEAARLGVNVGDYLTDMLLRSALIDHVNASGEAEIAPERSGEIEEKHKHRETNRASAHRR